MSSDAPGAAETAGAWRPQVGDRVRVGRGAAVWQISDITDALITLERNSWTHHSLPVDHAHRLRPILD